MMTSKGKGRFSAHILKQALLEFFQSEKLYPRGMVPEMDCVQAWALRNGQAMQRLVACHSLKILFKQFSFLTWPFNLPQYWNLEKRSILVGP